jgi:sulfonate transport system ATP-binding protein
MAAPVTLTRVGKTFGAQQAALPVLHDVQLQIAAGECVAVLGPSGCGKSTLLRLMAGLDHPNTGTVKLDGRIVADVDPRCAVVFQEPRLLPWRTIAHNIALGVARDSHAPAPDTLLELVGLRGFAHALPHQVSGGMAQRAALARALVRQPDVLLLDEPFAALDAFTRMQMQELLADVCRRLQPTVVLVTHDVDEALFLADRIVLLSPRPATIADIVAVPLRRPRDRGDAALVELRARILSHFGFSHAVFRNDANTYTI